MFASGAADAQRVPSTEYIRYVPLEYPRPIRQTVASATFRVFGDPSDPAYRDAAPQDGIDDARAVSLRALAARFSPLMVLNSHSIPMDPRRFRRAEGTWPLYVDTWNVSGVGSPLVRADTIDLARTAAAPCTAPDPTTHPSADCRLLTLVREFHPDRPASAVERAQARAPGEDFFRVFYLDFPGGDGPSWKAAYRDHAGAIREEYRDHLAVHAHPFVAEVAGGFEFAIQYWFFYPFNDGGNNHLGDWEHITVLIAPRGHVTRPLDSAAVRRVLTGEALEASGDSALVIRAVHYYFHGKVFTLDFAAPNVYADRSTWLHSRDSADAGRAGARWIHDRTRRRAYQDDTERIVNTHPIVYIGANNKGTDQVLAPPGGANRDSHGSFPFPGLYRDVGPAAAAEDITHVFDHRRFFAGTPDEQRVQTARFTPGSVVAFDTSRVRLVPDFEVVQDLLESDPAVRRDWAWLTVPIRFGYPAVASPLAGVVAHAETGNLSILAPTFNSGWNAIGPTSEFAPYDPQALPHFFPTVWQDEFDNSLGWLNLTLPTWSFLPPFDLLWRGVAAPVRAVTENQTPRFFAGNDLPIRFLGLGAGVAVHDISDDFADLMINRDQFRPLVAAWLTFLLENGFDSTTTVVSDRTISDAATSPYYLATFFVGTRFVSENILRHSRSAVGYETRYSTIPTPLRIDAELNMWEYAGSLRFNALTGRIMPYGKVGYGLSWYRLERVRVDGDTIDVPDSPWVRRPSLSPLENLLPNTFHLGAGIEALTVLSRRPSLPGGLDVGLKLEWAAYFHPLGLELEDVPVEDLINLGASADQLPRNTGQVRHSVSVGATVSF